MTLLLKTNNFHTETNDTDYMGNKSNKPGCFAKPLQLELKYIIVVKLNP